MDLTDYYNYQVTTRVRERFKQLRTLMESYPSIRIRIPGFVFKDGKKYETYEDTEIESKSNFLTITEDAKIYNNGNTYYHLLGTGIAVGPWENKDRTCNLYKTNLKTIAKEISDLLKKYPSRIDFGLVGNTHKTYQPTDNYIHLWGSNETNIRPDAIDLIENYDITQFNQGKNNRGGGQAGQFTYNNLYNFGINTMPDNDPTENKYRKQTTYTDDKYKIKYYEKPNVHTPDNKLNKSYSSEQTRHNELNYSTYKNQSNSCYYSGLWALLHFESNDLFQSNPLVDAVNDFDKKNKSLKIETYTNFINQYYKNIHEQVSQVDFNNTIQTFREIIQDIKKSKIKELETELSNTKENYMIEIQLFNRIKSLKRDNFETEQMDTGEFIQFIFESYSDLYQPDTANILYDKTNWFDHNNNELLGTITQQQQQSILPIIQFKRDNKIIFLENKLEITEPPEDIETTEHNYYDNGTERPSGQYKRQLIQTINKPQFFCIYLNRTHYETGKDITPYQIKTHYGPLKLYSIVQHYGGSSGGHYVCYFYNHKMLSWYLFDDLKGYIEKFESDPTQDDDIKRNFNFLVYFKTNEVFREEPDITIPEQEFAHDSYNDKIRNQIQKEYNFKPATMGILMGLIGWILYSEIINESNQQQKEQNDMIYMIGVLAIVISELIGPNEPINKTVKRFINSFINIITGSNKNSNQVGQAGGFNFVLKAKEIIHYISQILTDWVDSNKTIPIQQIVDKYARIIKNPTKLLIEQMELAYRSKSIEFGINSINSLITEQNYQEIAQLNPEIQIKILRGLGWKVSIRIDGKSELIPWDSWVQIGPNSKLIEIKKSKPTSIVKNLVSSYLINLNKLNLNLLIESIK